MTAKTTAAKVIPPTRQELAAERERTAQAVCDEWNFRNPVGTVVRYWRARRLGEPSGTAATTRKASVVGCETPCVWVEGEQSCLALTHVEAP